MIVCPLESRRRCRTRRRLLALPLLLVAAPSLSGCRSVTPAITVNGHEISMDEFESDLEALARNEFLQENNSDLYLAGCAELSKQDLPCKLAGATVAGWAQQGILNQLIADEVERRGIEVTGEQREQARSGLPAELVAGFPKRFADKFIEDQARFAALIAEFPAGDPAVDPSAQLQQELLTTAVVRVDPRYGEWNADLIAVVAPSPVNVPDGHGPPPIDTGANPLEVPQG
jgi:hypothetical protein